MRFRLNLLTGGITEADQYADVGNPVAVNHDAGIAQDRVLRIDQKGEIEVLDERSHGGVDKRVE